MSIVLSSEKKTLKPKPKPKPNNEIQKNETDSILKEAFVTFATPSHFGLLEVLIESVHLFTKKYIVAFGIDGEIPFSSEKYPRLIKRFATIKDCGGHIYFCKPYAIINSNIQYGVYVEADDIVTHSVEVLFEIIRIWKGSHTLSPIHPADPKDLVHHMKYFNISKQTTHYLHAHVIWNPHSFKFLKEWYSICLSRVFSDANYDESALNIAIWKNKGHAVCLYDPNYSHYLSKAKSIAGLPILYVFIHGCKDANLAKSLLLSVKSYKQPLIKGNCCGKGSKHTSLHPYICEFPA